MEAPFCVSNMLMMTWGVSACFEQVPHFGVSACFEKVIITN
jgi:hypothetical protein